MGTLHDPVRDFERLVASHRRELRAHCYRMSGSIHDAEELVQESLLRAWKGMQSFEGRASLRTWLYKIATNVCLEALATRERRRWPAEAGPPVDVPELIGEPERETRWIEPCSEEWYVDLADSPEASYGQRESVALAFLIALQQLPAKQRAVLLLREVVGLSAEECASMLGLSVPATKSALQRARATLDAVPKESLPAEPAARELLERYMRAWERRDVHGLMALLCEDAVLVMPPYRAWLVGGGHIGRALGERAFPAAPFGIRMLETEANGLPACVAYHRQGASARWAAVGIHVLHARGDRIARISAFLDGTLVHSFGFALELCEAAG